MSLERIWIELEGDGGLLQRSDAEHENLDIEWGDPELMKEVSSCEYDDDELEWYRAHQWKLIPDDPKERQELYQSIFARLGEHPEWSLDLASRRLHLSEGPLTDLIMHFYEACDWQPGTVQYEWLEDAVEFHDLRWAFRHPDSDLGYVTLQRRLKALRMAVRKLTEDRGAR